MAAKSKGGGSTAKKNGFIKGDSYEAKENRIYPVRNDNF